MPFHDAITDLLKSGLRPEDLHVRKASIPELSACGVQSDTQAYAIPYFNLGGKPVGFYRLKLFNRGIKYIQPKSSANHIFFPKTLMSVMNSSAHHEQRKSHGHPKYLIICEGEKKAAIATKLGFPTAGLGGVDSWKNRVMILPAQTEFAKASYNTSSVTAKIPSGAEDLQEGSDTILAHGFLDLIDYCVSNDVHIVICFDTDNAVGGEGVKPDVQRAASVLAFELRYRGVPFSNIHQLVLPQTLMMPNAGAHPDPTPLTQATKVGLDDFLVTENGPAMFNDLLSNMFQKSYSFPRHPNVREFVNRKLQKSKMSRKECQQVAIAILSDLDANGSRLHSKEEMQMYYFDNRSHKLMKVYFNLNQASMMHSTPFGQLLYTHYGISSADNRIMVWLDVQFNSEKPIEEVTPNRVIGIQKVSRVKKGAKSDAAKIEPAVRYQINDGQYVKVGSETCRIEVLDNGSEGFMFLSEQVEEVSATELYQAIKDLRKKPLTPWWLDVLNEVRLKHVDKSKTALALLYYVSPWLNKWMGMQLPVELVVGEPGSGKSSLYEHRLNILTGNPELRNAPSDLKDWHASITNAGGLHVTDNVQLVNRDLRQRLSDELCRIVTEPNPHIEMRRLYSNNELIRIPINTTFAITAIQQPFQNADLIQRAVKIELDKAKTEGEVDYDSSWVENQMTRFGGRVYWIAHHLLVLEGFFKTVKKTWDNKYRAQHRLIHFEQTLRVMARTFGIEDDWIPKYLAGTTEKNISSADWVIEGLLAFSTSVREEYKDKPLDKFRFPTSAIVEWVTGEDEYKENQVLSNSRALGRYLQNNKHLVKTIAKIEDAGTQNNRQLYKLVN